MSENTNLDLWIGYSIEPEQPANSVNISFSSLDHHIFVCGTSGSGKSVLGKVIIEEVLNKTKLPVIAIDLKGDIIQLAKKSSQSVTQDSHKPEDFNYFASTAFSIFSPGSNSGIKTSIDPIILLFQILNKNIPERDVQVIISLISSMIVGLLGVKGQTQEIYQLLLNQLLSDKYFLKKPVKSIYDLKDQLETHSFQLDENVDDQIANLKLQLGLLNSGPNSILFHADGVRFSISDLISEIDNKKQINIFYINSLTIDQKDFFMGYLTTSLYIHILLHGKLNVLIYFDEIKDFIPHEKNTITKKPLLLLLEQNGEYGLKFILSTQSPSSIDSNVIDKCKTRMYGLLTDSNDIEKIKKYLLPENLAKILQLKKNQFFVTNPNFKSFRFKTRWLYSVHDTPFTEHHIRSEMLTSPSVYKKYQLNYESVDTNKIFSNDVEYNETVQPLIDYLPVSPEDLDDILNINHILIFNKNTGISLFNKETGKTQIDPNLISGLLQAIRLFLQETFPVQKMTDRLEVKEIGTYRDEHGILIYFCEGKSTVTAVFLDRRAGSGLKRRLKSFVYAFEEEFTIELDEFLGDVSIFRSTSALLERYLGTGYLESFSVNFSHLPETSLSLFDDATVYLQIMTEVQILQEQLTLDEGFYFSELINEAFRRVHIPYFELLGRLISLTEHRILVPRKGEIWIHSPAYTWVNIDKTDKFEPTSIDNLPVPPKFEDPKLPLKTINALETIAVDEDVSKPTVKENQFDNFLETNSNEVAKSTWINQLIQETKAADIPKVRESILKSVLTREVEYDKTIGSLKLQFLDSLTKDQIVSYNWSQLPFKEKLNPNTFGGPIFALNNPKENKTIIISSIPTRDGKFMIFVFG